MSYLMQDDHKGIIISRRSEEISMNKYNKNKPFISRVTNKSPLGLPPIKDASVFVFSERNPLTCKNKIHKKLKNINTCTTINDDEFQNKRTSDLKTSLFKKIKKLSVENKNSVKNENITDSVKCKLNRNSCDNSVKLDTLDKAPHIQFNDADKYKTKAEDIINKVPSYKIEVENSLDDNTIIDKTKISTLALPFIADIKDNGKSNLCLHDEENNEEEVQNLLNFVQNLDYQKYLKDLEIREALYLIKNKVEKVDNFNKEKESIGEPNIDTVQDITSTPAMPIFKYEIKDDVIKNHSLDLIHEKEWDNSTKLNEDCAIYNKEIKQISHDMAKDVLKKDKKLRSIHSYNSVRRILNRENFSNYENRIYNLMLDPLKVTIIKEREGIHKFEYKPTRLINLRDEPII